MNSTPVQLLSHPSELLAVVQFAFQQKFTRPSSSDEMSVPREKSYDRSTSAHVDRDDTLRQCYVFLNMTSRSFAAVVQALDVELRDAIAIFYLVLRGLDTVEDDMTIPLATKVPELIAFWEKLTQPGWQCHLNSDSEKDAILLRNFDVVIDQFMRLRPSYQQVIADICRQMGKGMADFAAAQVVDTLEEWDLYCHYVAGLVGIGLCRMFAASGLESPEMAEELVLANSMGLFLQKVNIIRDYLEDLDDGRTFYPREVWSLYAESLAELREPRNEEKALACLNHLILNTLQLIPDCLEFMSKIQNRSVFRFCAIPQVMAIATLQLCFNNYAVFKQNVKIRKGLAVKLIYQAEQMQDVVSVFEEFCKQIGRQALSVGEHALDISLALGKVDAWIAAHGYAQ